jgi:hypothetical protein
MPTTKTRSPFFRPNLIFNPIGYDVEISTRLFQLWREIEFPAHQIAAHRLRAWNEGDDFHFVEQFDPSFHLQDFAAF